MTSPSRQRGRTFCLFGSDGCLVSEYLPHHRMGLMDLVAGTSAGVLGVPLGFAVAATEGKTMSEMAVHRSDRSRTWERPSMVHGALSGGGTVLVFAFVHDVWISDIWFNVGPMVLSGALCGLAVVWSYNSAEPSQSMRRWFVFNGVLVGLLVALGGLSFVVLDPRFTMAEAMAMEDALAELIPPALPLMIGAIVVGTALVWVGYGRRARALIPAFVVQVLLVFLVGHNLAILGLVELSGDLVVTFVEFIGLTALLGFGFAAGVTVLARLRTRTTEPGQSAGT